ncbi:hypothetical protein N7507_003233 [Penicillium longicatenatum]|nr:hypothetical protein N7507_003233 [Penicillium longicatenatum]
MVDNEFDKHDQDMRIELVEDAVCGRVDESIKNPFEGLVLVPQPTRDPNDPLASFPPKSSFSSSSSSFQLCFFTVLSTFNSSNVVVAVVPLSNEFHQSQTRTGYVVCFNLLAMGIGNLLWVPVSRVIGKRPVYLLALLLLTASNTWTYKASSYGSLLSSRISSGLASSAADATVPSLITDLFFYRFFIGPLISAYITQALGWHWTCGFLTIAGGATFLVGIFTIRESNYQRETANTELLASVYPPKRTFLAWMALTHGYRPDVSLFRTVWNTLCLVVYPPILWTGLLVGTFVGWNVVIQMTASRVFTKPTFEWKIGSIGLLALSGFIGAVIAFFLGGKVVDLISARMTKANHGVREPEFRLPTIIMPAIIGPMGVLTFGISTANQVTWVGAAFGYAMQGYGLTAASNVVVTYAVDSYHQLAGEALVIVFVIRNTIAMLLALYTVNWQESTGVKNAFVQMVGIQYFFLFFTILMFLYGKRIRAWTTHFGPLAAVPGQE